MDILLLQLPPDVPHASSPPSSPGVAPAAPQNAHQQSVAWRLQLHNAYQPPSLNLVLAEEVHAIDLADVNVQKAATYRKALRRKDLEQTTCALHLCHPEVKRALINSDYAGLLAIVDKLPQQLAEIEDDAVTWEKEARRDRRPIIYMHFHVDEDGTPPTVVEYYRIAGVVQRYLDYAIAISKSNRPRVADEVMAHAVEKAVLAPPENNTRVAYVPEKGKARYPWSKSMASGLRQWLAVRYAEYHDTPQHLRTQPVAYPVSEVGWTVEPNKRRFDHFEHGKSGNTVMNLIDAATRYRYPNKSYRMRWLIVMEPIRFDIAGPGERTVSRLASSYTTTGGTNQILGGLSVEGAYTQGENIFLKACNNYALHMFNSAEADKNQMVAQRDRIKAVKRTLEKRRRLTELREGAIITDQETKDRENEKKEAQRELETLTEPWSEMVSKEMRAIKQHERMVELARRINHLL